jgi:aquaporin Z
LAGAVIAGLGFRAVNAAPAMSLEALAARDAGRNRAEAAASETADEDVLEKPMAAGEDAPKPATKDSQAGASEAQEFFEGKR